MLSIRLLYLLIYHIIVEAGSHTFCRLQAYNYAFLDGVCLFPKAMKTKLEARSGSPHLIFPVKSVQ